MLNLQKKNTQQVILISCKFNNKEQSRSSYEHYTVSLASRGLEVHCSGIILSARCSPEWSGAARQVWVCGRGRAPLEVDLFLTLSGLNAWSTLCAWMKRENKRGHRFLSASDKATMTSLFVFTHRKINRTCLGWTVLTRLTWTAAAILASNLRWLCHDLSRG